ncbi:DUF2975 domain-containing protein [Pedobacter petrophilus]|uniref:DUF2975 domain-containing protein n=1 Tax=Pedobacter petrophilus TaxID=1908241 RepID=A0A7K0G2Z5_9SPHI|nr:DUF2975 domain-containing protein [Pedobacter petrophilus]MRX78061.1 DUF2975 domain-containing protein [Pedobacter petrophilus]
MKTQHQILIIKTGYILTLASTLLFSFNDAARGFEEGYNEAGKPGMESIMDGLLLLLICFLTLRVLIYLYRFINSVQDGNVFSEENTRRLSRMGFYCTTIPFLLFAFNAITYLHQSRDNAIQISDIIKHVDFEIWLLIFGLTLLTIAFVFKKGIELKQESELTIKNLFINADNYQFRCNACP